MAECLKLGAGFFYVRTSDNSLNEMSNGAGYFFREDEISSAT